MNNLRLKLVLEAIDKLSAPIKKMSERYKASIKSMQDVTQKLSERLNKVGDSMKGVGGKMSMFVSTPILGIGALSLRTAAQVDELTFSLSGMAGGMGNARNLMRELEVLADRSGKSMESMTAAAGTLMAAGYKGGNLTEQMRRITEISTGSKIELEQLAEVINKVRSEGKLEKGEIELMQKSSIPIIETLAEVLGKSRGQIIKLAEEGKITTKDLERAFGRMTTAGGVYYNKMEERSHNLFGQINSFKFNFNRIMGELGRDISDQFDIAGKLKMATDAMRGLADAFIAMPKWAKGTIVSVAMIVAIMGPLLMVLGQVTIGIAGTVFMLGKMAPVIVPLLGMLKALTIGLLTTPFGWFVLGAAAVAGAALLIYKNWGKITDFFAGIWAVNKKIFNDGVAWIMEKLQPLLKAIEVVKQGFGKIKGLATDNPVTRFVRENGGPARAPAPTSAYTVPTASGATQKVDAGGTLRIQIDSPTPARVVESRPNDRRMEYASDTGLLMGAP